MFDLVISGKIVDPVDGVYNAIIGVEKNRIKKISEKHMDGKNSIHLTLSQLIFPGFIDPHVHMREPGWEYKEDFLTGSKAALHGSVTTVGDMPNLPEPITNKERLLRKIKLAEKSLIDVLHFGGVGTNSLSDIKGLAQLVPAFKIYTAESTGELALKDWPQIEEAAKIISKLKKPITFHCEDQSVINKDPSRPKEAEIEAVRKVLEISKKYKTKANIAHLSAKESLELIKESAISYELTPHHLFLSKESGHKMNPPLRGRSDCNALVKSVKNGKCMIATDHAPHTLEEKKSSNAAGVPGLDTYGNFVLWLLVEKKINPEIISKVTSFNAANYLGIKDKARIKKSFVADLVILDKKGKTKIENKNLYTKCGWSAFAGKTFPGRVACTIKNGKIAMSNGIIT